MTEDRWYVTELGERAVRIGDLEAELERWKNRVRELEDAIIMHRASTWSDGTDADYLLWDQLDLQWT